ncbi:MAG: hypothetical protein IJS01_07505 [Lentisphaeria bacterium]|nr:hypothetical protein [Lentisphaeria bacterium]
MRFFVLLGLFALLPAYGAFHFTGDAGFEADGVRGELYLFDGKAKKEIRLAGSPQGKKLVLTGKDCKIEVDVEKRARLYHFRGTAVNTGKEESFWELGIRLYPELRKGDRFWGGVDVLPIGNKPIVRAGKGAGSFKRDHRPWLAFPVSAVFGGNRAVIAAGRNGAPVSYTAAALYPNLKPVRLTYSIRLVPGAGYALPFSLSAGVVPMRFENEENIVQAHYDAFPEDWRSFHGEDHPYIWGAHSYYSAWKSPSPDRELQRRRFASIEWAYTPWKRPGDVYGHEKFWDYAPDKPFQQNFSTLYNGEFFDYAKMTCAEFHARRKALFDRYGKDFGYCFYTCPAWAHHSLVKKYFPDSFKLTIDKSLPRELAQWTTLNHKEYAVMPMWSDYGEFFTKSLKKVYDELKPVGFAIDGGGCGVYYRGKAVTDPRIPERAWDAQGVFMDESAAVDKMVDFIHSLDGKNPPVAWKNGLGKSDFMMLETSIFNPFFRQWMPHMRYLMGQRPVSVHSPGFLFDQTIPGWRNMTHEQFMAAFMKLADHVVFTDFEYGFTQCFSTRDGNTRAMYVQPELLECLRLGWQALCPVAYDSKGKYLYRSRFGRGADTVLFFGNPWEEPMPLEFRADNTYLGGGVDLFARKMRDRAVLVQKYEAPDTVFSDTLPSRVPALYEAVVSLSQAPSGLRAGVRTEKDLNAVRCRIDLESPVDFKAVVTPRRIRNFEVVSLTVNGRKPDGVIPARARIEVVFRSKIFGMTFSELDAFPWLESRIELPKEANAAEKQAAADLEGYFSFLKLKMRGGKGIVRIRISPDVVGIPVELHDNVLTVKAKDADAARAVLKELKYAMDRKFPYLFKEPYGGKEMNRRFDFKKSPMPFVRCFEQGGK